MAIADYLRKLIEMKNQLVANLKSMGVTADESEKLNTLVPKVLECKAEQNVEFDENCNIISVNIPSSVTNIGAYFESNTNLKNITINDGVTSIGDYAFRNCSGLENIIIPDSVTSIGWCAFEGCSNLIHIEIPGAITDTLHGVFYNCTSLISVEFGYGVTNFEPNNSYNKDGCFQSCTNLKSIVIPHSVNTIGYKCFQYCNNLEHIYYTGTQTQWNAITKGTNWNYQMGSNVSGGTVIHYNYTR